MIALLQLWPQVRGSGYFSVYVFFPAGKGGGGEWKFRHQKSSFNLFLILFPLKVIYFLLFNVDYKIQEYLLLSFRQRGWLGLNTVRIFSFLDIFGKFRRKKVFLASNNIKYYLWNIDPCRGFLSVKKTKYKPIDEK